MARPKKAATNGSNGSNGSTALAVLAEGEMYRDDAFKLARAKAVDEYNARRTQQQHDQQHFASQYGRIDKIDRSYADDVKRLLVRTLAIARSKATGQGSYNPTPDAKISKLAATLSDVLASVELHLATDTVQDLFERIDEARFLKPGGQDYQQNARPSDDPETWIGPDATATQAFLAGIKIVERPTTLKDKDLRKADLDMEIKARDREEAAQHKRDREAREALQKTVAANCEHETRIEMVDDDWYEYDDVVSFRHRCALCAEEVALFEGKWYTRNALDDLDEARAFEDPRAEAETA